MNYLKQNGVGFLFLVAFVGMGALGWFHSSVVVENTNATDALGALNSTRITNPWIFDGHVVNSSVNSTSTIQTAQTLVATDIATYQSVILTPNTGDLTLTFPASSTLSTFIPTAGDRTEQCWYNATTTAGIDVTFAAGTGIDLEVATTTASALAPGVLTLFAGNHVCFTYFRQPATATAFDIGVLMTRYTNAD